MANFYLIAFRDWFDSNQAFLTQNCVQVPVLRQFQDENNNIAHAELETKYYLGDVSLWEYEGSAVAKTDFVEIATGMFHPKHHELNTLQEMDGMLRDLIMQMIDVPKPLSP